jgi:actin-related protein
VVTKYQERIVFTPHSSSVFPSMIGYPKKQKYVLKGMNMRDVYVGRDADRKRGILKIHYPLEHGIIQNWDDMLVILDELIF